MSVLSSPAFDSISILTSSSHYVRLSDTYDVYRFCFCPSFRYLLTPDEEHPRAKGEERTGLAFRRREFGESSSRCHPEVVCELEISSLAYVNEADSTFLSS